MVEYMDTENTGGSYGKDGISFEQLVLKQIDRIAAFANTELRGGYWQKKSIPISGTLITTEEYIPDSREVYSRSVIHLHNILLFRFDKEMKDYSEKHFSSIESMDSRDDDKKNEWFLDCMHLFQQLSLFLGRINYMKTSGYTDMGG